MPGAAAAIASRDRLDALIAKTRITAPIDGVVTARHVQPGEIAEPGDGGRHDRRPEPAPDRGRGRRVRRRTRGTRVAASRSRRRGTAQRSGAARSRRSPIPSWAVAPARRTPAVRSTPASCRSRSPSTEPTPLKLGQRVDVEIASPNPGTR